MKTVDVKTEKLISLPLEVVANYTANPLNAPEWYVNIKSAACLVRNAAAEKPGMVEVGEQVAFKAHFMGRKLAYTYEITAFEPLQKTGNAHRRRSLPHGNDLPLGSHIERSNPYATAQYRPAFRFLSHFKPAHGMGYEKGQSKRPGKA